MTKAKVIIIGGGMLGTSTAYHLAKQGVKDVLLLERRELATAASSQAAGLMFQVSSKPAVDQLSHRTFEVLPELEAITGDSLDFNAVGTVRIAESDNQKESLLKLLKRAGEENISVTEVDREWLAQKLPWLNTDRLSLAVYFGDEGYIDPYRLTNAYSQAARSFGVKVQTGLPVQMINHIDGSVVSVSTDEGEIGCNAVVVAGGVWANQLTSPLGLALPMIPTRSHFWIAAPENDFNNHQPMVVHGDAGAYTRPEVGGLLLGVQEARSRTFDYRLLPDDISSFAITEEGTEWDALLEAEPRVSRFFPGLERARFESYMAGLSAYTPDGHFLLGAANSIQGLYVAAGCCGSGVMASGGIGQALSDVIVRGESKYDLTAFDPHRFGVVDPSSEKFQERCAAARARKSK